MLLEEPRTVVTYDDEHSVAQWTTRVTSDPTPKPWWFRRMFELAPWVGTLSDTFTRATVTNVIHGPETGNLAPNQWANFGGGTYGIDSNQVKCSAAGGSDSMEYIDVGYPDVDVTLTLSTLTAGQGSSIRVRATDANNVIVLGDTNGSGTALILVKYVAGAPTTLGTFSNVASGDVIRLVAIGDDFDVYLNGVLEGSVTDSFNNTATKIGFGHTSTTNRVDNWSALVYPPVVTTPARGYVGLQTYADPEPAGAAHLIGRKVAMFTMWCDDTDSETIDGEGPNEGSFASWSDVTGTEDGGTIAQCLIDFDWDEGETLTFRVESTTMMVVRTGNDEYESVHAVVAQVKGDAHGDVWYTIGTVFGSGNGFGDEVPWGMLAAESAVTLEWPGDEQGACSAYGRFTVGLSDWLAETPPADTTILKTAANSAYVTSMDNTTAHDSTQWDKARNGTGATLTATTWLFSAAFGVDGTSVSLPFFPNGLYSCDQTFLEFDTSAVAAGVDCLLRLHVTGFARDLTGPPTFAVAAYDYGAAVTTADFRTSAQLAALTKAGTWTLPGAVLDLAANTFIEILVDSAAINAGGTTRLILWEVTQESSTPPNDGHNLAVTFQNATLHPVTANVEVDLAEFANEYGTHDPLTYCLSRIEYDGSSAAATISTPDPDALLVLTAGHRRAALSLSREWRALVRLPNRSLYGFVEFDALSMVLRYNLVSNWVLDIPWNGDLSSPAAQLLTPNAGVVIVVNGAPLIGGPVATAVRTRGAREQMLQVTCHDDMAYLLDRRASPEPATTGPPYNNQAYDLRGPARAESLMKQFVDVNAGPSAITARQIAGLTVEADLERGSNVRGRGRWQTLLELVQSLAMKGGVGFRVATDGPSMIFQVYEPEDKSSEVIFAVPLGNLAGYTHQVERPAANHVFVGGGGTGTGRTIVERDNDASVTNWGRIETFIDTSDTTDTSELAEAGDEQLQTDAAKYAFAADALDTATHQWARIATDPGVATYDLGDLVSVLADDGVMFSDVVREIHVEVTPRGTTILPVVGTPETRNPARGYTAALWREIRSLRRQVRDLQRG